MSLIVTVFCLQFLADWVLQPPKMGKEKSERFNVLAAHISIIFLTIWIGTLFHLDWLTAAKLSLINAFFHALIDWNIWNLYRVTVRLRNLDKSVEELKKDWKYWLDPVFGWFLGFDQLLHFVILYLIYGNL